MALPINAGTPVREALDGAATAIGAAGCATPRLDAEVLLADILGVDRARLLTDRELSVAGPAVRAYQNAVRRPTFSFRSRRRIRHRCRAIRRAIAARRPSCSTA